MTGMLTVVIQSVLLCAMVLATAQDKANVSGTWGFQVETTAGSGAPTFIFKQDGESLTGKYSGALGEADLKGTVKGDKIDFSFSANGATVTYSGTISGETMSGKVTLGDQATGTWTGKRK